MPRSNPASTARRQRSLPAGILPRRKPGRNPATADSRRTTDPPARRSARGPRMRSMRPPEIPNIDPRGLSSRSSRRRPPTRSASNPPHAGEPKLLRPTLIARPLLPDTLRTLRPGRRRLRAGMPPRPRRDTPVPLRQSMGRARRPTKRERTTRTRRRATTGRIEPQDASGLSGPGRATSFWPSPSRVAEPAGSFFVSAGPRLPRPTPTASPALPPGTTRGSARDRRAGRSRLFR
jgi:hypothetical protein